jgi:hypothetical protein
MAAELFMAKKKTAGPETTPIASTPAAPAKRRAAARPKSGSAPIETAPAESTGGPIDRDTAPDMGAGAVGGAPSDSAAPYAPTFEQIAEEAYQRYLNRGGSHGADFEDWIEAERKLRERTRS